MVGQAQRDREGIHHRAGAKHRGKHDVADEAGQAREQREAADGEDFSDLLEHRVPSAGLIATAFILGRAA
jgi:hypothetical protein